jgi:hypothetical protein
VELVQILGSPLRYSGLERCLDLCSALGHIIIIFIITTIITTSIIVTTSIVVIIIIIILLATLNVNELIRLVGGCCATVHSTPST